MCRWVFSKDLSPRPKLVRSLSVCHPSCVVGFGVVGPMTVLLCGSGGWRNGQPLHERTSRDTMCAQDVVVVQWSESRVDGVSAAPAGLSMWSELEKNNAPWLPPVVLSIVPGTWNQIPSALSVGSRHLQSDHVSCDGQDVNVDSIAQCSVGMLWDLETMLRAISPKGHLSRW